MAETAPIEPGEIATRSDLGRSLTAVRARAGLSIRSLAADLKRPPSTLGGYFGGRHIPPPGELRLLLTRCGVERGEIDAWLEALRRVRAASDRRVSKTRAPYRGLEPFGTTHADLFFGRGDVTAQVVAAAVAATAPVTVVGPSGSGKSSILRAGVVPALRERGLRCAVFTPVPNPVLRWPTP